MLWRSTVIIIFKAKVANVVSKSAFRSPLKYALVREACISSISDSHVASRVRKLACFAQIRQIN